MTAPILTPAVVPSGGAITLTISGAVSGLATLQRAASGSSFSQIYSGQACAFFIDTGDGLPSPLLQSTPYQYIYTDSGGSGVTPFITPTSILVSELDTVTEILIRLIQAGIAALAPTLPAGLKIAQVTQAMPLGGSIPMPLVVVNLDYIQQSSIPIGQSVPSIYSELTTANFGNTIVTTGFTRRTYRVSVISANAPERNFYRDNVIGIFEAIWATVLQPLGLDVSHKWQVTSGQVATDRLGQMPGFYFAEIIMDFEGTFNVLTQPTFGLIETISGYVSGSSGLEPGGPQSVDEITVPLS